MEVDNFNPKGKKFLAIFAHPDDACFGAGGTILKWKKQGAKGAIVIATNGDKGSSDRSLTHAELSKLRHEEQLVASKFLGLEKTWFLDYPDAHLEVSQELKSKIVKIIREYQPDIVLTFDPSMLYSLRRGFINHPDHRAISQAAVDSVFPMARDFLTFPEHAESGLEPHKVTDLFLYNFDNPNYASDITDFIEEKIKLLKTHTSQINDETVAHILDWNKTNGKLIGTKYAEVFVHLSLS